VRGTKNEGRNSGKGLVGGVAVTEKRWGDNGWSRGQKGRRRGRGGRPKDKGKRGREKKGDEQEGKGIQRWRTRSAGEGGGWGGP